MTHTDLMVILRYPELADEGCWAGTSGTNSSTSTYTQADIKAVAARCESRFVKLVLEIDTPAHTLAVAKSHPEMMADWYVGVLIHFVVCLFLFLFFFLLFFVGEG